jgi:hypothetical protein
MPAASDSALAPGAGHGGEGDASFQGPARKEVLSAQPKPTHAEETAPAKATASEPGVLSPAIALAARIAKPETAEATATKSAIKRETGALVTVRAKPEKRLNAKDRAKARRGKGKAEAVDETAAKPETASSAAGGLSTAHPKPDKRKKAKERAAEKYAKAKPEDGTTPMTAKAKSKGETKAKRTKAAKAA